MECNKEEAVRAKGIAENLMQKKNFPGARRIALKAQQLYKDLDNISQILIVCDVHCFAEKKICGNEMDWYGILQIEQTADEATIKKQYRKFALQLHPDKNKFPGAEAAFKLIGEAQAVLLDKAKRNLHDSKRNASINKPAPPYRPSQRPIYSANVGMQSNHRSNFTSFNPNHQHSQRPAAQRDFSNGRTTFWTACPFCSVRYQYYIEVINKQIVCQNCNKAYIAYERSAQGAPIGTNLNQSSFPQRKNVPNQGACNVEPGSQKNFKAEHTKTEFFQKKQASEFHSEKMNGMRQNKGEEESSESCTTEGSTDPDEEVAIEEDGDFKAEVNFEYKGEHPRRSERRKRQVSYKENLSDDEDFASNPKRAKGDGASIASEEESGNGMKQDVYDKNEQSGVAADVNNLKNVKNEESKESIPNEIKDTKSVKGKENIETNGCQINSEAHIDFSSDSSPKSTPDADRYVYPDPDFHDFDKDRSEEHFSEGQMWALYDTPEGMPRFYALIRDVFSPGFKLQITWLEAFPDNEDEREWVNEDLPVCCGKFKLGSTEIIEDVLMFSHQIECIKGSQRNTYKIFPRKGETWALFKNWDMKWKSDGCANRKYEYEYVEILSEFTEGVGARVAYLAKVKGFVSVFCKTTKKGMDIFDIPPAELFRFSHVIPSFKLTGEEREGVPKGSFELDPAALPGNILEIANPEDLVGDIGKVHCNGSSSRPSDKVKPYVDCKASTTVHQPDLKGTCLQPENESDNTVKDCSANIGFTPEGIQIPDSEFFNFDALRSIEKFQVGQIWSLYSDEEGLPKYYGKIMKVQSDQGFKLRLRWLTPCMLPANAIQWCDEDMPICCGTFNTKDGRAQYYKSVDPFSHQLTAEPAGRENEYVILPRKGEVWALYRNWSADIKLSDLENCEYDVVEVLEVHDSQVKVSFLELVEGFKSVFKTQVKGGSAVTQVLVLPVEMLRFSHQIPAFRLTNERSGSLRGFWELDPAALPVHYFAMS